MREFSNVFHHEISINEFWDYVENVLQNSSNLAKAEVPSSVQKAKILSVLLLLVLQRQKEGFQK